MDNEIQLVSDGKGLAVIGNASDVERFLEAEGLPSQSLEPSRLSTVLNRGATAAQAGSDIAANSGRWVKLTKESAEAVKKYGLIETKTRGVSHAMVGKPGEIKQWIQIVKTPGTMLTNPAMLSGVAGMMTQFAMQQQMDEIVDYLARIDEKVDSLLRAQTNQVLARMDGVDLAIREAALVRDTVGRVSEVTWSKVQSSSSKILETQGFALRQLADLAEKLERKAKLDELADTIDEAKADVQKWLSVLARCFQLHDAIAILELDRVMDASPGELDRHRLGLDAARQDRLELISQSTERLLVRMIDAAGTANSKVLFHPAKSPAVVESSGQVALGVHEFRAVLGIESGSEVVEARRWTDAAAESWEKARETSADGVVTVKRIGNETLDQARTLKDKLTEKLTERKLRRTEAGDDQAE